MRILWLVAETMGSNYTDSISDLLAWLGANPVVSFLLSTAGVIIGVAGFVLAYRSRAKTKAPCFAVNSVNIVSMAISRFGSLKVLYEGKRVENFTATKIAFWNAGRDTIMRKDIPRDNPLAIGVEKGCRILAADILDRNVRDFSFKLSKDQSEARISFDYLEKDQGAVLQVLHTAPAIQISGKILGGKHLSMKDVIIPPEIHSPQFLGKILTQRRLQNLIILFLFLIPFPVALSAVMNPTSFPPDQAVGTWLGVIFWFVFCWVFGFLYSRRRLPKGLESYWKVLGEKEQEKQAKQKEK